MHPTVPEHFQGLITLNEKYRKIAVASTIQRSIVNWSETRIITNFCTVCSIHNVNDVQHFLGGESVLLSPWACHCSVHNDVQHFLGDESVLFSISSWACHCSVHNNVQHFFGGESVELLSPWLEPGSVAFTRMSNTSSVMKVFSFHLSLSLLLKHYQWCPTLFNTSLVVKLKVFCFYLACLSLPVPL